MIATPLQADLIVIGGGASGLVAAIAAARSAKPARSVLLLEKNETLGRKILATGNGRCNLSNLTTRAETFHGQNPMFAAAALQHFSVADTLAFFLDLGLPCREEADGRIYPVCQQAAAVLDVLKQTVDQLAIQVVTGAEVIELVPIMPLLINDKPLDPNHRWQIKTADGATYQATAVILATGGCAAPNLGSDGSGYDLAGQNGHHLVDLWPALVQVETVGRKTAPLAGIRVESNLTLLAGNQVIAHETGEVLLTDYGLSGIPILQLARQINQTASTTKTPLTIELDLLPELSTTEITTIIRHRCQIQPNLMLGGLLTGLVHQKISRQMTREVTGLTAETPVAHLTTHQMTALAQAIKAMPFTIKGTRDFSQAQVTAGGLDCSEFNPATLESILHPGLFAAGEVLDIDGDCGGFNLQWAWSSGHLAGQAAAHALLEAN
ncbi:MAG: aminoacetone oxidase family FAD-binding enzyme [Eubacteriales bacterium]|nr:aminoacetone oxidase family FAD-binding enzyme [Eubacteriales bacterium]